MGQSLNLYLARPSGRALSEMYLDAWRKGLKTTYYLRSRGATNVEKSSMDVNRRGIQPRWMKSRSASSRVGMDGAPANGGAPTNGAASTNGASSAEAQSGSGAAPPASLPLVERGAPVNGEACSIDDPECEACQ
jgi:ribonucleoside-diphosphate reductase alpha chain